MERVRGATCVAGSATNYRYARNGSLGRTIVAVFSSCVVGGLLSPFRTRVRVSVQRKCSLQVRRAFGRRVVPSQIRLNSPGYVNGRTSYNETSSQASRSVIIPNVFSGVPCGRGMVCVSRIFSHERLVVRTLFRLLYCQVVALLGSLVAGLIRVFPKNGSIQRVVFQRLNRAGFGLRVASLHSPIHIFRHFRHV